MEEFGQIEDNKETGKVGIRYEINIYIYYMRIRGDTEAFTPLPLNELYSSIPLWGSEALSNPLTPEPPPAQAPFFH